MDSLGAVAEILNDSLVLVQLKTPVDKEAILTVFKRVTSEELKKKYGLAELDIPKGEIRIIGHQKDEFYLAERFLRSKEIRRPVQPFIGLSGSLLSSMLARPQIRESVPGGWSAEFSEEGRLNLSVDPRVQVGDQIGR
jgi:hypothetical protein